MPADISSSVAARAQDVMGALKRAGAATGAGEEFLARMAARESSFDPTAKAKTSSAAGLFQFIEQTWFGALKQYGSRHGLGAYAADIMRGDDGRFTVADEARRTEILDLRFNADAAAALAGELANENRSVLERRLGRVAKSADLYMAHFLGPAGAVKLLSAAATVTAAEILPAAAAANRHVFYDGARAKSAGEVIASIARSMTGDARAAEQDAAPSVRIAARADHTHTDKNSGLSGGPVERKSAPAGIARAFPPPPAHLSSLALSVLQALDPLRLAGKREDRGDR